MSTKPPLHVLWVGPADMARSSAAFDRVDVQACHTLDEAAAILGERTPDALLIWLDDPRPLLRWSALSQAVLDAAVVVVAAAADVEVGVELVRLGVQDMLSRSRVGSDAPALALALRLAVQRKQHDIAARKGHARDLATGLPNHAQLLEHMTHLLALREREPAPMALLVLRVEGLATTTSRFGVESANVLRRKAAVRLRAALRASDVVAAIGADTFAVLLAWIDAPADAERVATKLAQSLRQPFNVAGHEQVLAVSVGSSRYPEQGKQADVLLRRAQAQATSANAQGRAGFANFIEGGAAEAANDERDPPAR